MLKKGKVVGPYRIESYIATGSMGEIYKVVHTERGTVHALKYLPLANSKVRKRLLREAELQTKLSHTNVVTLTEVMNLDGDPALVMEYVDGPSLDQYLESHKLTVREAETFFLGIVSGVAHAHRRGLVHRDLKPSNVLLARTPGGLVPKVADFGIAKATGGIKGERLTHSGSSLGSPAYMAPEQIQDAHEVDHRADIFSLGCMLYEMVTGARAFDGSDTLAVLNAVSKGDYAPAEHLVPDLPDRLRRAIDGSLASNPRERISSCERLLEILTEGDDFTPVRPAPEGVSDSEAVTAQTPSPRRRTPEPTERLGRAGAILGGGVAGTLLVVGVLLGALGLGALGAWLLLG